MGPPKKRKRSTGEVERSAITKGQTDTGSYCTSSLGAQIKRGNFGLRGISQLGSGPLAIGKTSALSSNTSDKSCCARSRGTSDRGCSEGGARHDRATMD
jgi:hypothetical protein